MKYILYLFAIIVSVTANAQDWTWMKGPAAVTQNGVYGTKGIASPNNYPGSRHGGATWVDGAGNLWLMGGEGHGATGPIGWINDLWKYDPSTNQWTWINGPTNTNNGGVYGTMGVASPTNMPGAREFASTWKDAAGNFWLFGGDGFDSANNFGHLCDLWKYDPVSNQWTWINGSTLCNQNGVYGSQTVQAPTNMPGGRIAATAVIDASGNAWLHGGYGYPVTGADGFLSDLWKYDPSVNQWTWMKGMQTANNNGVYGTLNTPSPLNYPGGRSWSSMWIDGAGTIWMFGGDGFAGSGGQGYLNDVWKYSPAVNRWVWVNGPNTSNANGVYGTLGVPAPTNSPGARSSTAYWMDNTGKFWIFGGIGFPAAGGVGRMSDLFRYDPVTAEWTWMKGPNTVTQPGTYGAMGTTTPANNPGERYYNIFWKDGPGNLWLFGGNGLPATPPIGNLCDLWKYTLSCTPENITAVSEAILCSGNPSTLTAVSSGTGGISWFATPSSTAVVATGSVYTTPTLTATGADSVYLYYVAASLCAGPRTPVSVTVHPLPSLSVTTSNSLLCTGQSSTLTVSGASTYSWSTGSGAASIVVSPTTTSSYTVNAADSNSCANAAVFTQSVSACTGISLAGMSSDAVRLYPNPNQGSFVLQLPVQEAVLSLYNVLGQKLYSRVVREGANTIRTDLPKGLYYCSLVQDEVTFPVGKVLIE